ncbi:hypothetical protein [Polaribacter sp.]|uniref:hypothetical protein n=1 Tax=Polaribacter sp. TaxID=1920175 RepID=UPI003F6CE090
MNHQEKILFRKLLKKNGFVKSDTSANKKLMEFIKKFKNDKAIFVYTYEDVEVYFDVISGYKIKSIKQFAELYLKYTKKEFNTTFKK